MARRTYFFCAGCQGFHKADGAYPVRWSREHLDRTYGPDGWDEIRESEVAAWRAGVAQQRETADHE